MISIYYETYKYLNSAVYIFPDNLWSLQYGTVAKQIKVIFNASEIILCSCYNKKKIKLQQAQNMHAHMMILIWNASEAIKIEHKQNLNYLQVSL
jgi:hypothetical protein